MKRLLVIDPSIAGISGDMFVSAAVDLGGDERGTREAMLSPKKFVDGCKNLEIKFLDTLKNGFRAKQLDVKIEEDVTERTGGLLRGALRDCLDELSVSSGAKEFARSALDILLESEAMLHDEEVSNVHLHEAGSIDTLVDIIGASYALDDLGIFDGVEVLSMPTAVGGGELRFSHGRLTNPSQAVLEIARLKKMRIVGGPVPSEIATPTGMALLSSISSRSLDYLPPITPTGMGVGAGKKDFELIPNILRMILGDGPEEAGTEEIVVLETNLDDLGGEDIAHAMERVMAEGGKDVSAIPTIGKKGRPGFLLRVMTEEALVSKLSDLIMRETGTLGVRALRTTRHIATRELIQIDVRVDNSVESVNVKLSRDSSGEIIGLKPEFEDIKRLAKKYGRPLRILREEIIEKARKDLLAG